MAATKRPPRRKSRMSELLEDILPAYLVNRTNRERSTAWENHRKAQMMEILSAEGEENPENGHRRITLDKPLEFRSYKGLDQVADAKNVTAIERRKRAGTLNLNPERTMEY